jgi:hypothetical protein
MTREHHPDCSALTEYEPIDTKLVEILSKDIQSIFEKLRMESAPGIPVDPSVYLRLNEMSSTTARNSSGNNRPARFSGHIKSLTVNDEEAFCETEMRCIECGQSFKATAPRFTTSYTAWFTEPECPYCGKGYHLKVEML